jgi:hypothetical protein
MDFRLGGSNFAGIQPALRYNDRNAPLFEDLDGE